MTLVYALSVAMLPVFVWAVLEARDQIRQSESGRHPVDNTHNRDTIDDAF